MKCIINSPFLKEAYLEVFCGPMKSGKTREIINYIDKINYIESLEAIFIKPKIDTRDETIKSRFGNLTVVCNFVDETNPDEILKFVNRKTHMLVIDEVHFFDKKILFTLKKLLKKGLHIVVAGLDTDFRGMPFGCMGEVLCLANKVNKLEAVCDFEGCSNAASKTQRMINGKPAKFDDPVVLIGDAKEGYGCRCNLHHEVLK